MVRQRSLHNAKILPHEALEIRLRVSSGQSTPNQEADRYHVGVETIRRIVRKETHRFAEEQATEVPVHARRVTDKLPAELLEAEARESKERFLKKDEGTGAHAVDFFLKERLVPKNPLDEGDDK